LIATLLAIPVVFIATTMPMQAIGSPVSPASAGDAILTIDQSDAPDPVSEGSDVTYTVIVGNSTEASGDATNVSMNDFLSDDVDFVSSHPSQGTCDDPVDGAVMCDLGTIGPGSSAIVAVVVTTTDRCSSGGGFAVTPQQLTEPCTIFNDVSASSPDSFDAPSDQEDTTVEPAGSGAITLTKSDSPDPVQELNPITYTLNVRNTDSESNANNVVVTDDLPAGATFSSASTTTGSCSHTSTTVTCNLGTLAPSGEGPGETVTIVVQAPNVTTDTTITNEASVSSSNAGSSSASANTLVFVSNGHSTTGEVPPGTTKPMTFTTGTQSANGQTAVTGTDKTAVSLVVPAGGPGGSLSLDEVPCPTAPCTGAAAARDTAAQQAASAGTVVLGGVAFDVVPPDNYPNNKPFRAIMLWDKTLGARKSPVFYFKAGVTAGEITLPHCGTTPPNGGRPCVITNAKITTGPPIVRGDWKVVVRINSDPRMRK
jgi:uncharacterized repeat protein (TIGR01451 family)